MATPITEEDWFALPISNDFMFSKVMADPQLCKEVVELLIDQKVGKVRDFQEEKTINITHDSKSVRLDVYLQDEEKVVNVEMQVSNVDDLVRRSRYYECLIALGLLESGHLYRTLPNSYVIFICTFDPIGNGRARNSYQNRNDDTYEPLSDGTHKIFFNATTTDGTIDPKLQAFLNYVCGQLSEDDLVQRLNQRLEKVKNNTQWRIEYMKFEADQQLRDRINREEGREEGLEEGKIAIAKNLLDVLENSVIALKTGLSISEVQKLRESTFG